MLAKVTQQNQKDWDVHLPHVLFAYRTSIHESTGFSPYYINFGRSPTLPVDVMLGRVSSQDEVDQTMPQYVQQVCQSLKEAYTTARQRISITQRRRKEYKDRTATTSVPFNGNASTDLLKLSVMTRMYLWPLSVISSGPVISHDSF